jgi:glycogen operon protein
VTYSEKHNLENFEENRDGTNDNRSSNYGLEGPSTHLELSATRLRQRRNFLTTLLLSQGVPMLLAGDELGRTQRGNNNAYCQDNEISWVDWDQPDEAFLGFVRQLLALRRNSSALSRPFGLGPRGMAPIGTPGYEDRGSIQWFNVDGTPIDWARHNKEPYLTMGALIDERPGGASSESGHLSEAFFVGFNATKDATSLIVPAEIGPGSYLRCLNTGLPDPFESADPLVPSMPVLLGARSTVVYRRCREA